MIFHRPENGRSSFAVLIRTGITKEYIWPYYEKEKKQEMEEEEKMNE